MDAEYVQESCEFGQWDEENARQAINEQYGDQLDDN